MQSEASRLVPVRWWQQRLPSCRTGEKASSARTVGAFRAACDGVGCSCSALIARDPQGGRQVGALHSSV